MWSNKLTHEMCKPLVPKLSCNTLNSSTLFVRGWLSLVMWPDSKVMYLYGKCCLLFFFFWPRNKQPFKNANEGVRSELSLMLILNCAISKRRENGVQIVCKISVTRVS